MILIRYRNLVLLILLTLAIGLLMIGSYYDLEISKAFADPSSVWAGIIEVVAEPPTILLCSLMCGIIFLRMNKERKIAQKKAPLMIFMFFMIIAGIGTVSYAVIRTLIYLDSNLLIAVPVIPIICALIFTLSKPIEERMTSEMIQTTISCIISAVLVLITINIIKSLWGRVRYRDMYALGDMTFSHFTDWFRPNGINIASGQDGHKSFPSGHTSNVVLLFYLSYYAKYLNKHKNKTKIIVISAILISLWSIITAVSRVAIGAHYLSDVTAGAAITGAIVYFVGLRRHEYSSIDSSE